LRMRAWSIRAKQIAKVVFVTEAQTILRDRRYALCSASNKN
jgi:hypothetical protein